MIKTLSTWILIAENSGAGSILKDFSLLKGLWTEYHKLRGYKKSEMLNGNEYKMVIRKQTNILLNPVKTVPSSG